MSRLTSPAYTSGESIFDRLASYLFIVNNSRDAAVAGFGIPPQRRRRHRADRSTILRKVALCVSGVVTGDSGQYYNRFYEGAQEGPGAFLL